jgi:hypothetical protein
MEIVTATARRERSFPDPIDVNAGDAREHEEEENEKETFQRVECKGRGGDVELRGRRSEVGSAFAEATADKGWPAKPPAREHFLSSLA